MSGPTYQRAKTVVDKDISADIVPLHRMRSSTSTREEFIEHSLRNAAKIEVVAAYVPITKCRVATETDIREYADGEVSSRGVGHGNATM